MSDHTTLPPGVYSEGKPITEVPELAEAMPGSKYIDLATNTEYTKTETGWDKSEQVTLGYLTPPPQPEVGDVCIVEGVRKRFNGHYWEVPLHKYVSTKKYDHNAGLSATFRQWRAQSHCRFLHGYAIAVKLTFASFDVDVRNWVVDFGSLKSFKAMLEDLLDHKTLVAEDDPMLYAFQEMEKNELIQLRVVPATGCEAMAKLLFETAEVWLKDNGYAPRCWLESVEVSEHTGNSAVYATTA